MKHKIKMAENFAKFRTWTTFTLLIVTLLVCPSVRAKTCLKKTQCSCEFDDGSGTVDVTSIGRQDHTPLVQDMFAIDGYAYSFNPCFPFTEGTCVNAAACQVDMSGALYYNIGDSSSVDFAFDGTNVIATYLADDLARTSIVKYICQEGVDPPQITADGETAPSQYSFTITSKAACPSAGPPPTGGPTGPSFIVTTSVDISVGSVLTIIFFVVLVIYVVAGMSYNRFRHERTGKELVPNLSFWGALPVLIKEGFRFTFSLCGRRQGYERK